jgi:hypothetical protein
VVIGDPQDLDVELAVGGHHRLGDPKIEVEAAGHGRLGAGHEGPDPVHPLDKAVALQDAQDLAHGRAADPVGGGQLGLGRQPVPGLVAGLQVGHELLADLDEERLPDLREWWHERHDV